LQPGEILEVISDCAQSRLRSTGNRPGRADHPLPGPSLTQQSEKEAVQSDGLLSLAGAMRQKVMTLSAASVASANSGSVPMVTPAINGSSANPRASAQVRQSLMDTP
jgi:hypothetical protein